MKNILFITLVLVILLSGCSSSVNQTESPKKFVQYFDKTDSKIFINCNTDADCKLQLLGAGCTYYGAINKNNSESDIAEYFKKQKELTKNIVFNCMAPSKPETLITICNNGICTIETRK